MRQRQVDFFAPLLDLLDRDRDERETSGVAMLIS
jgi:hypothetical protein